MPRLLCSIFCIPGIAGSLRKGIAVRGAVKKTKQVNWNGMCIFPKGFDKHPMRHSRLVPPHELQLFLHGRSYVKSHSMGVQYSPRVTYLQLYSLFFFYDIISGILLLLPCQSCSQAGPARVRMLFLCTGGGRSS